MYTRDRYVCRYCGTRVIDLRVLEALAIASLPYGAIFSKAKNWRFADTHPAFWWQSGSNDHLVARSRGGDVKDLDNLVTACWPCQHRKSNYTLAELGWKVREVKPGAPTLGSTLAEWDGLVELLEPLKAMAAKIAPPRPKRDPRPAIWARNSRGAYNAKVVGENPWVYEARNGLWRVKECPRLQSRASGSSCAVLGTNGNRSRSGLGRILP
jgi:hypothetical protein